MEEMIVLDEDFLNTCINCSGFMEPKTPYDFWCCKKCEKKGNVVIKKLGEEYAKALGDYEPKRQKKGKGKVNEKNVRR